MSVKLTELPYHRDSSQLFTLIAHEPWSIFLDSGFPNIDLGRYDILACRPFITLTTRGQLTTITDAQGKEEQSNVDPFALVKEYLGE